MKLLQSEIDVVPGRKPQKQPLPEGYVGTGVGTLLINNATPRQNSYTIRLRCDQPFWQDAWYTLAALAPTGGPENAPPTGKQDQIGPRNQSLTIFIKDGGTRNVLLSFFVPEKSECRAGVYKATVVIETRIVSDDPQSGRKERITEIPITVIVRPFHKWTVSFSPEERRVGLFRRKADFELAVDNQGNDWLYCDLKLPRPQNVLIETAVQRLAIPPPEPGSDSVRTVPVRALTRMRVIRGARTPTSLPLTVQRQDAPSLPTLPEEAAFGPSGANLGAAVVASETDDVGVPEVPSKVLYCPPIPDTLTAFFEAVGRNARGLVFAIIGTVVVVQVSVFAYEFYFKNISEVHATRASVKLGEPLRVRGKNLVGSRIMLFDPVTKAQIGEPVEPKPDAHGAIEGYVTVVFTDPTLDHKTVVVGAQRAGKLTFLNRFLPIFKDNQTVLIGSAPEKAAGPASGSVTANVAPGQDLTIGGVNFGAAPGKVLIDGNKASVVSWTDSTIKVKVPSGKELGDTFSVAAFTAAGTSIPISPPTVSIKMPGAGDVPPDKEPQIGPDGQLIAPGGTSGGGSGGGSGGSGGSTGSSNPPPNNPPPTTDLPQAYDLLLSDSRSDYVQAVSQTRGARASGDLAVQAYAYAALNRREEAKGAARKALTLIGKRSTGKDYALSMLALARVAENESAATAGDLYARWDKDIDKAAPGFVFKDLAIARFKASQKSDFEAKIVLKDALRKSPSPAERSAIQALLSRLGG